MKWYYASGRIPHIILFHFNERSKISKSVEIESRLFARGLEEEGMESDC